MLVYWRGKKNGKCNHFLHLEPRAVQQKEYMLNTARERAVSTIIPFWSFIYICVFFMSLEPKKAIRPCSLQLYVSLYVICSIWYTPRFKYWNERDQVKSLWESSSSCYPQAPRRPAMLCLSMGLFIATELGSIIWPEQHTKPKLFSLHRGNEVYKWDVFS